MFSTEINLERLHFRNTESIRINLGTLQAFYMVGSRNFALVGREQTRGRLIIPLCAMCSEPLVIKEGMWVQRTVVPVVVRGYLENEFVVLEQTEALAQQSCPNGHTYLVAELPVQDG